MAAPERPLAGSRSPALESGEPPGRDDAGGGRTRAARAAGRARPPLAASGVSSRTSAVTRGCSESCSARMPPTHISHTSSSRAISSVQGQGVWSRWRPTTCRPTTAACAATRSAIAHSRTRPAAETFVGAFAAEGARRHQARAARSQEAASELASLGLPERLGRSQERAAVDLADRHALRAEALDRRAVLGLSHRALSARRLEGRGLELRAKLGRKPRQPHRGSEQAEDARNVAGARHVVRDLEETLLQRRARVVLVAVDDTGLERRVHLAEGHRGGARTHQLHRLDVDRRLDRPDLEPGELARLADVARARDHLSEAERVAPGERPHADGRLHVVGRFAPDAPVHDAVDVVPVAPQERKVEDLQLRSHAAPDGGARHHEVDEPFLELLHHLALLAEGAARKQAHLDGAAGRRLGQLTKRVAERVERRGTRGHGVGQAEHDRPAAASGAAAGEEGGCGRGPAQEVASTH